MSFGRISETLSFTNFRNAPGERKSILSAHSMPVKLLAISGLWWHSYSLVLFTPICEGSGVAGWLCSPLRFL